MKKAVIIIFDKNSETERKHAERTASKLVPEYRPYVINWEGEDLFRKVLEAVRPSAVHFCDTPELFADTGFMNGVYGKNEILISEYMHRKDFPASEKSLIPSKFVFANTEAMKNVLPLAMDFDMEEEPETEEQPMKERYAGRTGMVVTFYKTNYNTYELLQKTLKALCFEDWFIVLATHSPVPAEIQGMCDLVIYEAENVADQRRFSHGVAETSLIRKSLRALQDMGVEWTFKICYDTELNDLSCIRKWTMGYRYDFVSCKWGDKDVSTNSFFANVKFTLENFSFFDSIEVMFQRSSFIEDIWDSDIRAKGLSERVFTYPSKEEMFGTNRMDTQSFSYGNVQFRFEEAEKTFYVDHFGEHPLEGRFSIVDYHSDLAIYVDDLRVHNGGIWIMPNPVFLENDLARNGYYLEVSDSDGNEILRRNVGIRDFRLKHRMHRIHNGIRKGMRKYCKDAKYPEMASFHNLEAYSKFRLKERKPETFIDAGAHAGMFSLAMLESGAAKGYLIEPEPKAFRLLSDNMGTGWIRVIEKALYRECGQVEFNIFSEFETTNSIDPTWQPSIKEKIKVEAITVDELFAKHIEEEKIDLFKIDIEGGEYDAFMGMSDETMSRCNSFLIEYHANRNMRVLEIVNRLLMNGFSIAFDKYHKNDSDNYMLNDMGIIFAHK